MVLTTDGCHSESSREPTVDDLFRFLQERPALRDRLLRRYQPDPWRPSDGRLATTLAAVRAILARGETASQKAVAGELGRKSSGTVSAALSALVKSGLLVAPPRGPGGGGYTEPDYDATGGGAADDGSPPPT